MRHFTPKSSRTPINEAARCMRAGFKVSLLRGPLANGASSESGGRRTGGAAGQSCSAKRGLGAAGLSLRKIRGARDLTPCARDAAILCALALAAFVALPVNRRNGEDAGGPPKPGPLPASPECGEACLGPKKGSMRLSSYAVSLPPPPVLFVSLSLNAAASGRDAAASGRAAFSGAPLAAFCFPHPPSGKPPPQFEKGEEPSSGGSSFIAASCRSRIQNSRGPPAGTAARLRGVKRLTQPDSRFAACDSPAGGAKAS